MPDETIKAKKITDLVEGTDISDEDLFVVGTAGTASLRKKKWSTLAAEIKTIITGMIVQNATTAETDKLASAAVAKDLQDQITAQNTKMSAVSGQTYNEDLDDILTSSSYRSGVYMHLTQQATNNPAQGNISLTITYKLNNNWGEQYQLSYGHIRCRSNSNGTISSWITIV